MNETRRRYDWYPSSKHEAEPSQAPIKPDPRAHAEILVLTYGLQTAGWIAETNLATARRSDTPYWTRVLQSVTRLREAKHQS